MNNSLLKKVAGLLFLIAVLAAVSFFSSTPGTDLADQGQRDVAGAQDEGAANCWLLDGKEFDDCKNGKSDSEKSWEYADYECTWRNLWCLFG